MIACVIVFAPMMLIVNYVIAIFCMHLIYVDIAKHDS